MLISRQARDDNKLLARMNESDFTQLLEAAEIVRVPLHEVIGEPGVPMRFVHFPISCVFSMVVQMRDGSAAEAATIGKEGFVGLATLVDERANVYRIVQEVEGESLRVPATHFQALARERDRFHKLFERYAMTLTHQTGRNAGCNLRHKVGERLCRWLLMTHDRVSADEFFLTQEDLAAMLGVRRQSVTEVAKPLQDAGLIFYNRGRIKILDRPGLERLACECYSAIRDMYEQVMGLGGRSSD